MNWERHTTRFVRTAASGDSKRAVDLLREHLAGVGCDPLAFRIVAQLRQSEGTDDDFENLASQLQGATRPHGRAVRDGPDGPHLGDRDRADRALFASGPGRWTRLGPVASGTT